MIGICAAIERARWGAAEAEVLLSPRTYAHAVQRAGALVLVLSPDDATTSDPEQLLALLDGLLLAGGSDVDPGSYGAAAHPETRGTSPERDRFELSLAAGALERDLPVLGICRGMQIVNVAAGGSLVQHLPDVLGDDCHRGAPGAFCDHDVRLEGGSLAARVADADRLSVRSLHHQALDALGDGLEPTGWSVPDEVIEAVELPERRFALGVLWHPEEDLEARVIGAFVDEAGGRA